MNEQLESYEGDREIHSDPWGILSRENRNHWTKYTKILGQSNAEPADRVLEVGCGNGIHTRGYVDEFELTAVDISRSLTHETRAKTGAKTIQADARDLPFASDVFDAVVGNAIAHHLDDWSVALEEWLRVTDSGGSITLAEPNYLFPLDFATAHTLEEEQHKTQMAPWRVKRVLRSSSAQEWELRPFLYTPPLPQAAIPAFDAIDAALGRVPGVRWASQMLLIHAVVP